MSMDELLEKYEFLKARIDSQKEELEQKRNEIITAMKVDGVEKYSVQLKSGKIWSVSSSMRERETVTKKGKKMLRSDLEILQHDYPGGYELNDYLKTTKTEVTTIREVKQDGILSEPVTIPVGNQPRNPEKRTNPLEER